MITWSCWYVLGAKMQSFVDAVWAACGHQCKNCRWWPIFWSQREKRERDFVLLRARGTCSPRTTLCPPGRRTSVTKFMVLLRLDAELHASREEAFRLLYFVMFPKVTYYYLIIHVPISKGGSSCTYEANLNGSVFRVS